MVMKVDPSVTLGPLPDGPKPRNDDQRATYGAKALADRKAMARKIGGGEMADPYQRAKGVSELTGLTDKANLDKWADYARKG